MSLWPILLIATNQPFDIVIYYQEGKILRKAQYVYGWMEINLLGRAIGCYRWVWPPLIIEPIFFINFF